MSRYILSRMNAPDAKSRKAGGFACSTFPGIYGIALRDDVTATELEAGGMKKLDRHVTDRPLVVGLAAGLVSMDKIRKGLLDADVEVAVEAGSWMAIDQLANWFAHKHPLATDLYTGHYPV